MSRDRLGLVNAIRRRRFRVGWIYRIIIMDIGAPIVSITLSFGEIGLMFGYFITVLLVAGGWGDIRIFYRYAATKRYPTVLRMG